MEKIVEFIPAFDKRHDDPAKNYGFHGVELRMVLKGELGAVQFVLYTNWQLPHVSKEMRRKVLSEPLPADLGYHSPCPKYEGQMKRDSCEYLDGKPCYYDGSGFNAQRIYEVLLEKGSDGVWQELELYYQECFEAAQLLK